MFIEGADIPLTEGRPFKLKETLKTKSPSGHTVTTTRTMFKQNGMYALKVAFWFLMSFLYYEISLLTTCIGLNY